MHFAPSTYYAIKSRNPSARSLRDEELKLKIIEVHKDNYSVYGLRKLWAGLKREGIDIARCTTSRLMADLGICGVRRGKTYVTTTISDELQERPKDLVKRVFTASAPNRLWVSDITYVKTRVGWAYTAFLVDVYSRKIVGWKVSASLRSDLATDALEMALASRGGVFENLTHHSDRGVQYLSVSYSQALLDAGIAPSVGTTGDSYDNALSESNNALYKTEMVRTHGDFNGTADLEWATLLWVDWFNNRRLHGSIGMIPPSEFKSNYYTQRELENRSVLK